MRHAEAGLGGLYKRRKVYIIIRSFRQEGIKSIPFLFLHENICCGYSLEASRQGASNEYPQCMFSRRNKKFML